MILSIPFSFCLNNLLYIQLLPTEAGNAVFDVITGQHNPAGRTVVTWYTDNSQLPPMTNYSMVNRTYRYMKATPLYKFGYGLSYTKFLYSELKVSASSRVSQCCCVCMTEYVVHTCTQVSPGSIKPCQSVLLCVYD